MGAHPLVNELVTNRHELERLGGELGRLIARQADLMLRAEELHVPVSEIAWAAGCSEYRVREGIAAARFAV